MRMKLETFRVVNCFGFRDSGEILLSDSSNVIYLLGKNSSGKTAVITALESISSAKLPHQYDRFKNFEDTGLPPVLIAKFVRLEGAVNPDAFVTQVTRLLEDKNAGQPFLQSAGFASFRTETASRIREVYEPFLQEMNESQHIWLVRDGTGDYQVALSLDMASVQERLIAMQAALGDVFRPFKAPTSDNRDIADFKTGSNYVINLLRGQDVENTLSAWFPHISRFGGDIVLSEPIPDHITQTKLDSSSPIVSAFVTMLGREQLSKFLKTANPRDRRLLVQGMQQRLNVVVNDVNHYGETTGQGKLLELELAEHTKGLQVAALTSGKYSTYGQISDNTKLLFAYYLYMHSGQQLSEILLFDEPNNGFHASAQEELLRFLKRLGADGRLVVVSTHSEYMIDIDHLTGIRKMDVDGDYLFVRNKWNANTSGRDLALRPVMDAIGLRLGSSKLSIKDRVIITEGPSEYLYLYAFRELCGRPDELHIAPANGDEHIPTVVALVVSQSLAFKVVVDTVSHGKSAKTRIQEGYPIDDQHFHEVAVPRDEIPTALKSGVEDIFSKADFGRILVDMGEELESEFSSITNSEYIHQRKKRVPKLTVATWFSQNLAKYPLSEFDNITRTRIEMLVDFCANDAWYRM